jgi:protein adenylyltransferase
VEVAREALAAFEPRFQAAHLAGLRRKLGLSAEREGDAELARDLLARMAANGADYTLTFRRLCDAAAGPEADADVPMLFADPGAYDTWAASWRCRLAEEPGEPEGRRAAMRAASPAYIPRNHLVEAALAAAVEREDLGPFEELLAVVTRPYEERPEHDRYAAPRPERRVLSRPYEERPEHDRYAAPRPERRVFQTFCGT